MKNDWRRPLAWAAYCSHGRPGPFISEYSVRSQRIGVMEYVGTYSRHDGEDWRRGWRRAYREGWRVVQVRIVPVKK